MEALRKLAAGALCVPLMLLLCGFFYGTGVNTYNIAGFSGIDCTGATDSASGLQNAINAIPDASTIFFPTNCTLHIGSTVSVTDRVGLLFTSGIRQQNAAGAPQLVWIGANHGTMFDIEHSDHPTFTGFRFITDGTHTVDGYLFFDGTTGGSHIGTAAEVAWNDFGSSGPNLTNASFVAVSWSFTARTNHENYYIHDNTVTCNGNGQQATNRAKDGVTNGTTTLTSATAAFTSGDTGSRIRLSYPGAQGGLFIDTTMTFVNSTTVTLGTTAAAQTNVQITTGTNTGIGFRQGRSQNAKHTRILGNQVTGCDVQAQILGGSADIRHLGGGFGGTGVMIGSDGTTDTSSSMTDSLIIEQVENEGNLREFDANGGPAPIVITGSRVANANQLADGFYKLGGAVTLIGSGSVSSNNSGGGNALGSLNNANAVVVGEKSNPVVLTSIGNQWGTDATRTGYTTLLRGAVSISDNIGNAANLTTTFLGNTGSGNPLKLFLSNLPTSAPGGCTGTGQLWNNSGVLTVC